MREPQLETLPAALREAVAAAWDGYCSAGGSAAVLEHAAVAGSLPTVWACSRFVITSCQRDPDLLPGLIASGLQHPVPAEQLRAQVLRAGTESSDEAAFMRGLRQLRRAVFVRIAWRDLAGWASLDETLEALSVFADAAVAAACEFASRALAQRFGQPHRDGEPQDLVMLAMGKLGGGELNFSSDIDLVPVYPAGGETGGRRPFSHAQYFSRLAQKVIQLLSASTEDGFVFRVDTRLRPFGDSGPPVQHFAAFEAYLVQHGREWERYAYIKARPLTGSPAVRREVMRMLRPFVFRRYLDFGVFESLRDMHEKITAEVQRRELRTDIKRGPGGIREIEFIAQALQLLRGGREPGLRVRPLQLALQRLSDYGRLPPETAEALTRAYRFLRRVENRIQVFEDAQWHRLPDDASGRIRLAWSMGFTSWEEFDGVLCEQRATVIARFGDIVIGPRTPVAERSSLVRVWDGSVGAEEAQEVLTSRGIADPGPLLAAVTGLRGSARFARLGERARARLDELIPRLLAGVAKFDEPAVTFARVLALIEAVASRSAYLALLNENPQVLDRLLRLCARSPWIAAEIVAHPLLLDELIDPRCFKVPPDRAHFAAELELRFRDIDVDDLEQQMDALRQFKQAAMFQVAVSDLSGVLPLMKVSDRLTDIAELVLEQVTGLAAAQLAQRHGLPPPCRAGDGRRPGFAIVGYGKLGGIELGYGSDLDLVFVHDAAEGSSDGEKPLEMTVYFARLATRIVHFLSTQTRSGVLYEVDMRLRPSGKGGLLVTGLAAFETYQKEQAWIWEQQALLRARAVAGSAAVCASFERIRRKVLCVPRDRQTLRREVRDMRSRMREQLVKGGEEDFDIKQGAGGIADIEFLVQYLVLAHTHACPALLAWSDNIRQLEELTGAGLLAAEEAASLADAYRAYRQRLHRLALGESGRLVSATEFSAERAAVDALWQRIMET